jgi:chromate transport protein ChrA
MRIKYKSEESYWIICLVSLLISIVCFILNRVFNDGIGGISFVLPIVMLVLTLIVKGGNFKDSKTGDTMMSAVLIIALVSYLGNISSLLSVSTSLYFKNASNLNTVLGSLGLVFGISAIIVVVVTAIAFALFASRQKNGENNKKTGCLDCLGLNHPFSRRQRLRDCFR